MDAERFHTDALRQHASSRPVSFTVPLDFPQTCISALALHTPGEALGGTPPTFLIKAGVHEPTPCPSGATTAVLGSGGTAVAEATVLRDGDIYHVTIDHQVPSGPWSVAIRNDESLPQTFYGVIADTPEKTRQSWSVLLNSLSLGGETAGFRATKDSLDILNVGTATLNVLEGFQAGDRFGPPRSPVTIVSLPGPIKPHRIGSVVVECPPLEAYFGYVWSDRLSYALPCNDVDPVELTFRLNHPQLYCKSDCDCRGYSVSLAENSYGICDSCGHSNYEHGVPDEFPDDGTHY